MMAARALLGMIYTGKAIATAFAYELDENEHLAGEVIRGENNARCRTSSTRHCKGFRRARAIDLRDCSESAAGPAWRVASRCGGKWHQLPRCVSAQRQV